VLWTLTIVYVASAIVTTGVALVASRPLVDEHSPATHRLSLAAVAGLLWPVMLLGAAEFSSVVVYSKVVAPDERDASIAVLV
jgi:hypothetical protein